MFSSDSLVAEPRLSQAELVKWQTDVKEVLDQYTMTIETMLNHGIGSRHMHTLACKLLTCGDCFAGANVSTATDASGKSLDNLLDVSEAWMSLHRSLRKFDAKLRENVSVFRPAIWPPLAHVVTPHGHALLLSAHERGAACTRTAA